MQLDKNENGDNNSEKMDEQPSSRQSKNKKLLIARNILRELFQLLLHQSILLVCAGFLLWFNAWLLFSLNISYEFINYMVLYRNNPDLIFKRGSLQLKESKRYETLFVALYSVFAILVSAICGLDGGRYKWFRLDRIWLITGVFMMFFSYFIGIWAMKTNKFFETTYIIRPDHAVCSDGPYKIVRHPGYLAALIGIVAYPLILQSGMGLITSSILLVLFIIRTHKEDNLLAKELKGYSDFKKQTKYKLLPFIW